MHDSERTYIDATNTREKKKKGNVTSPACDLEQQLVRQATHAGVQWSRPLGTHKIKWAESWGRDEEKSSGERSPLSLHAPRARPPDSHSSALSPTSTGVPCERHLR
jgi:hypothetical protein